MARQGSPRSPVFLVAVFAAIGVAIAASFLAYSLQPPRSSASNNLGLSPVTLVHGNASFAVRSVSGGPYMYGGFQILLTVNGFAGGPVGLGPNNSAVWITIGPNRYRTVWSDANGNAAVDLGDSFLVSGDGGPLPSLSFYEFDLRWEGQWMAKVSWSTP